MSEEVEEDEQIKERKKGEKKNSGTKALRNEGKELAFWRSLEGQIEFGHLCRFS